MLGFPSFTRQKVTCRTMHICDSPTIAGHSFPYSGHASICYEDASKHFQPTISKPQSSCTKYLYSATHLLCGLLTARGVGTFKGDVNWKIPHKGLLCISVFRGDLRYSLFQTLKQELTYCTNTSCCYLLTLQSGKCICF